MSDLAIIGRCFCNVDHSIPVPDKREFGIKQEFQRVVCWKCAATLQDLKIMGSVSAHETSKPEIAPLVI